MVFDSNGGTRTLNLAKARYDLDTVLDTRVLDHGGLRVGYLHFYQFLNTSAEELADAFATLASDNIDELVLDLRYNYVYDHKYNHNSDHSSLCLFPGRAYRCNQHGGQ